MIPTASEFRELQSQVITQTAEESRLRFIEACNQFKYVILVSAQTALETVCEKGLTTKHIYLDNELFEPICGYSCKELVCGVWDKASDTFDSSVFAKFEISKPFDLAKEKLEELGYKLKIADEENLYIKLSWDEKEEENSFKEITIGSIGYLIDADGIVYKHNNISIKVGAYNIADNEWFFKKI